MPLIEQRVVQGGKPGLLFIGVALRVRTMLNDLSRKDPASAGSLTGG